MQTRTRHLLTPLACAGLLALAACGGGGGGGGDSPPPAPTPLTLSGTAATGAALSGAAVTVECASGRATATAAADGGYSVTLADATAPCLVRATSGMTTYYSLVAAGSASPATVNLTPLTTLITTQVLGADPAEAFDDFDAGAQALLTPAAVMAARDDLRASLAGQVDLSGIDPITTAFVVGDATDQLLDDFGAALVAAQLTLPEVAAALLANPGVPAAVQTSLAPALSSCPSLRSAPIVLVSLGDFVTATVDSATLTTTYDGGVLPTETLTDLGNCEFSSSAGGSFVVSPAAIAVSRFPTGGGNFSMAFGFPRQQIPLSELDGNWNFVEYQSNDDGPFMPRHGSFTLNSTGRFTGSVVLCTGFNTCETEAVGPDDALTAVAEEAGGGFIEGGTLNRAFAYRAPNGTTMLFYAIDAQDGFDEVGFVVATKQSALALPAVTDATPFTQFAINGTGLAGAISRDVSTVTATSATGGGSFSRTTLNGVAQTFDLNSPRSGMRYRAAGSSMGTPFNATVQLPTGAGVVLGISAAEGQNFFNAAVTTPAPAAP